MHGNNAKIMTNHDGTQMTGNTGRFPAGEQTEEVLR